jgi:hypothetical protein
VKRKLAMGLCLLSNNNLLHSFCIFMSTILIISSFCSAVLSDLFSTFQKFLASNQFSSYLYCTIKLRDCFYGLVFIHCLSILYFLSLVSRFYYVSSHVLAVVQNISSGDSVGFLISGGPFVVYYEFSRFSCV